MSKQDDRVNAEWLVVNAIRELMKISTKNNDRKCTYDNALKFGGAVYPELLGQENSILRRAQESDTTREYRQRAEIESEIRNVKVSALSLVVDEIARIENLLNAAKKVRKKKGRWINLRKGCHSLRMLRKS